MSDGPVPKKLGEAFSIGSQVKARIVDQNTFDVYNFVTLKNKELEAEILTIVDFKVGSRVRVSCEHFEEQRLIDSPP